MTEQNIQPTTFGSPDPEVEPIVIGKVADDENPGDDPETGTIEGTEDPETFPREYVEDLRKENAKYRQRANDRDDIATRLHTSLVAATGRLQDPSDLTFDESHLVDGEGLTAALDSLLTSKPHLASRRPVGNIGQGVTVASADVDLAGILRSRAS
jgi:hypothetical protein